MGLGSRPILRMLFQKLAVMLSDGSVKVVHRLNVVGDVLEASIAPDAVGEGEETVVPPRPISWIPGLESSGFQCLGYLLLDSG
jgi:hypothetical protein